MEKLNSLRQVPIDLDVLCKEISLSLDDDQTVIQTQGNHQMSTIIDLFSEFTKDTPAQEVTQIILSNQSTLMRAVFDTLDRDRVKAMDAKLFPNLNLASVLEDESYPEQVNLTDGLGLAVLMHYGLSLNADTMESLDQIGLSFGHDQATGIPVLRVSSKAIGDAYCRHVYHAEDGDFDEWMGVMMGDGYGLDYLCALTNDSLLTKLRSFRTGHISDVARLIDAEMPINSGLVQVMVNKISTYVCNTLKEDGELSLDTVKAEILKVLQQDIDSGQVRVRNSMLDFCIYDVIVASARKEEEVFKAVESDREFNTSLVHYYLNKNWKDEIITGSLNNEPTLGRFAGIQVKNSMFGPYILKQMKVVVTDKTGMSTQTISESFPMTGRTKLSAIGFRKATEEEISKAAKIGAYTKEVSESINYLHVNGHGHIWNHYYGHRAYNAEGRVVIDHATYFTENPDRELVVSANGRSRGDEKSAISIEDMPIIQPFVYGYSMRLKAWLSFDVRTLGPIKFSSDALSKLVLPTELKTRLVNLVTAENTSAVDLIAGKGAGSMVLSYGGPGTGKTTTSEAIAEFLQRPLYYITVGELGTDPESLEQNLRNVLDIAERWNAIVNIDEVDIFVRERDGTNISRDAMTGIFLRLLEYYSGIMFLSTNLIDKIDKPFLSRIGMVLNYGKGPSEKDRVKVWNNLGRGLQISSFDPVELAEIEINNRDIKNILDNLQKCNRLQPGEMYTQTGLLKEMSVYLKDRYPAIWAKHFGQTTAPAKVGLFARLKEVFFFG